MSNVNETELILIIGEINVPDKIKTIIPEIKNSLLQKKFSKILSTGSIGSQETLDWVSSLCHNPNLNLHIVKSENDENVDYSETKVVKIGNFKIGIINGYQITPWDDIEELNRYQKYLDSDIIISGFTNKSSVRNLNGYYYINPGSLTGAFSPLNNDSNPSFMLMIVEGDVAHLYSYSYNNSAKNFEITKLEINKLKVEE